MSEKDAGSRNDAGGFAPESERLPVRVTDRSGRVSEGELLVQRWKPEELRRLATLGLLVCWTAAALSVLIPFVNFLLTPLLVIVGLFVFFRIRTKQSVILGGSVNCPKCRLSYEIKPGRLAFPLDASCNYCHEDARIDELPAKRDLAA